MQNRSILYTVEIEQAISQYMESDFDGESVAISSVDDIEAALTETADIMIRIASRQRSSLNERESSNFNLIALPLLQLPLILLRFYENHMNKTNIVTVLPKESISWMPLLIYACGFYASKAHYVTLDCTAASNTILEQLVSIVSRRFSSGHTARVTDTADLAARYINTSISLYTHSKPSKIFLLSTFISVCFI